MLFLSNFLFSNTIYKSEALIVINNNIGHIKEYAALELKKHLELVLGEKVLITTDPNLFDSKYVFYIGVNPNSKEYHYKDEESNYIIKDNKVFLFGDDKINKKSKNPLLTSINIRNKVGTLFSVYDFLHNELNVDWVEPGNKGIIYSPIEKLTLINKAFNWNTTYKFRIFRNDIWKYSKLVKTLKMKKLTPKELQFSEQEVRKIQEEDLLWKRRMKLGISLKPEYGHAFRDYWERYGQYNPEWFALGKNKQRGIWGSKHKKKERVKFCVSKELLQDQIVNNWKKEFEKSGKNIYNASVNDSKSYCRCDECLKLDSIDHIHDDFEEKSKTDRYVYFWNKLISKSKDFNNNAKVIAYAYSDYRYPPINKRLEKDIILGFVPKFSDLSTETSKDINLWKKKGLESVFLRPNDFNDDIGMPMGHEKYIYDKFKVFNNTKILGIDYDTNYNFYNLAYEGISLYILSKAISEPSKSFSQLNSQYLETFGSAKLHIKKFYEYWRNNFEIKRLPFIKKAGGFEGRRYLYKNINDFYTKSDFLKTNKILKNALLSTKNIRIKERIETLIISNTHSLLLLKALNSGFIGDDYDKLINYRIEHKNSLKLTWPMVFHIENKLSNLNFINQISSKIKDIVN